MDNSSVAHCSPNNLCTWGMFSDLCTDYLTISNVCISWLIFVYICIISCWFSLDSISNQFSFSQFFLYPWSEGTGLILWQYLSYKINSKKSFTCFCGSFVIICLCSLSSTRLIECLVEINSCTFQENLMSIIYVLGSSLAHMELLFWLSC